MIRKLTIAAVAAGLVGCAALPGPAPATLPEGAYIQADGCINIDATPKYPRLDYRNPTWWFDGVAFGTSPQEDECITPL